VRVAHAEGFERRDTEFERGAFDRRRLQFLTAPRRPIGLRDDEFARRCRRERA
jgi:hypothetical protein